jgi:hypothetical protein
VFVITYWLKRQQGKVDVLSYRLYLVPKEGDETYKQQCDVILQLKYLQLQALSIIHDDTTLICQIHEDLKIDLLVINIQGQSKSHYLRFFNEHAKFEC